MHLFLAFICGQDKHLAFLCCLLVTTLKMCFINEMLHPDFSHLLPNLQIHLPNFSTKNLLAICKPL